MTSYLTNILTKIKQVQSFLVGQGPSLLRNGADAIAALGEAMRYAADYIDQYGSLTQFAPGSGANYQGGVDSAEAQATVAELKKILDEFKSLLATVQKQASDHDAMIQKQLDANVNAGLLDWTGKIDPSTMVGILQTAISLITKVLVKSGAIGLLAAPKATEHGRKK